MDSHNSNMEWFRRLKDSENNSDENSLVNESLKNKLRNFGKDAEQALNVDKEQSFHLPRNLFERPKTKVDVRKSYIQRMVDNYNCNKSVSGSREETETPRIDHVVSSPTRAFERASASTPTHRSNAKVPIEDSLLFSPIPIVRPKPKDGKITRQRNQSSINLDNPENVTRTNTTHSKKNVSKLNQSQRTNDSNIVLDDLKNTPTLANESSKVKEQVKSGAIKKTVAKTKQIKPGSVKDKKLSKKKQALTVNTLNPDQRRTFFEEPDINQNDKYFNLGDESIQCDTLPEYQKSQLNRLASKQKVVILENIQIQPKFGIKAEQCNILPPSDENNTVADTEVASSSKGRRNNSRNRSNLHGDLELLSKNDSLNNNEQTVSQNKKQSSSIIKKSKSKKLDDLPLAELARSMTRSEYKKNEQFGSVRGITPILSITRADHTVISTEKAPIENNEEFVKPTRLPPKRKAEKKNNVGSAKLLRSAREQELPEEVDDITMKSPPVLLKSATKNKKVKIQKRKNIETVQIESISTTESNDDDAGTKTTKIKKSRSKNTKLSTTDSDVEVDMQIEEESSSTLRRSTRLKCPPKFLNVFFSALPADDERFGPRFQTNPSPHASRKKKPIDTKKKNLLN